MTENDSTREIVARMIDGEAFGEHAMSFKPGPGDFPSNWQNRRDRAYRTADEVIAFLSGRLLSPACDCSCQCESATHHWASCVNYSPGGDSND